MLISIITFIAFNAFFVLLASLFVLGLIHGIISIGIHMDSLFFYKLGIKKIIYYPFNIEYDKLIGTLKQHDLHYSVIHKKFNLILARNKYNIFNYSENLLFPRIIFNLTENNLQANIFYNPFVLIDFLCSLIFFSLLLVLFTYDIITHNILLIISFYCILIVVLFIIMKNKLSKSIQSYIKSIENLFE